MSEASISEREIKILLALDCETGDGMFMSFSGIAERAEVPLSWVRRSVRALARKGLAEYAKGLWTEDGKVAGSGYGITPMGRLRAQAARLRERE